MASPTAPTIDESGISAPTFDEVLAYLQTQYRSIYGQDIYLGNDSQDGQFLGIVAAAINDANAATVACYNAFSPNTAQGNGLSSVVKINGIMRLLPSKSTADVKLVGVVGTVITNGVVSDVNNKRWLLPDSVTIPLAGEITVTATAQDDGAIDAAIGEINKISTPVYGWQSVTNPSEAVTGDPLENDAELRVRQQISVAVPSLSIFEGIVGSVANIVGVEKTAGYENDTNSTDANGLPGHSISLIVEGGDATEIANIIAEKKTPGTGTNGSITTTVIDSVNSTHVIKFSRPTHAAIKVNLSITALTGWSATITPIIKQAIADYVNSLAIGEDVEYFALFVPANLSNTGYASAYKISAMTIAKDAGAFGTADITIPFDGLAVCDVADISITVS